MMVARPGIPHLLAENDPASFWRPLLPFDDAAWEEAAAACAPLLPDGVSLAEPDTATLLDHTLGEGYMGRRRWQMSGPVHQGYRIRKVMPRPVVTALRTLYHHRPTMRAFPLRWPVEDRFVQFQQAVFAWVMREHGMCTAPYTAFWPDGHQYALVLTHDVDTQAGHDFALQLAEVEERYGFRSSFNFVPERYQVDPGVLAELRARGFEIGVHGLHHDGREFASRATWDQRVQKINEYIRRWGAVGFRSPLVHRQPEWMQALEVEYDASCFDTEPRESMPGGVLTIWPFFLGRFVELPYTLVQDHTLMISLRERTPRLWLDKLDFIARNRGMALAVTHPDYLNSPARLAIYERFLDHLRGQEGYWHTLPRDVARWWRDRAAVRFNNPRQSIVTPHGYTATVACYRAGADAHTAEAVRAG